MTIYRPTRAPRGRLVRLGVMLDTRNTPARVREIAEMCDGAGIDVLWVREHLARPGGEPRLEAWTALALASSAVSRARVGATVAVTSRTAPTLAAMATTLDAALEGRLELALSNGWVARQDVGSTAEPTEGGTDLTLLEEYAVELRALMSEGGPPISVEATTQGQMDVAVRVADGVVIPTPNVSDALEMAARVRRACERSGRDPATLGICLEVPVSIGRTFAEAEAREKAEPLFETVGAPSRVGLFGTLERCQERVIELAHAGVTDLRCVLPNTPDVHDVIAQLTAIAVGTVDLLSPGTPRSRSPDPPETWGGRSAPIPNALSSDSGSGEGVP